MDTFSLLKCVSIWGGGEGKERRSLGETRWGVIDQVQAAFRKGRGRTLKLLGQPGWSWGADPAPEPRAVKPAPLVFPPQSRSSLLLLFASAGRHTGGLAKLSSISKLILG